MAYHRGQRRVGVADVGHVQLGEVVGPGLAVEIYAGVEAAVRAVAVDEDAGILQPPL